MAQQIKKKFIKDDAVDGAKLLLLDGQAVRAKDSGGAAVDLLKLDVDGDVAAKGAKIAYKSEVDALDGRLDIIEGADNVEGSVAKAEKDAKDYADQKVADLVNSAPEVLDTLKELSDALGGDANFSTTISGQIGGLDGRLDTLEGDALTSGSVANAVAAEASLRQSADQTLTQNISLVSTNLSSLEYEVYSNKTLNGQDHEIYEAQIAALQTADEGLDGRLDILEADPTTKTYVDGVQSALDGRLDALEVDPVTKTYVDGINTDLDGRLDVIEGADNVEGSVAKAEKDAKDYADQKVADLVNSAPATLDTLKELADALGSDPNFATTVSNQIGGLDSRLDTLEGDSLTSGSVAYAVAAEAALRESEDLLMFKRDGSRSLTGDVLPGADVARSLGSSSLRFLSVYSRFHYGGYFQTGNQTGSTTSGDIYFYSGNTVDGNSGKVDINTGAPTGNGNSGMGVFGSGFQNNAGTTGEARLRSGANTGTGNTGLTSVFSGAAMSGTSGNVKIYTGASSTGNSGDIEIYSGLANAGTRGKVKVSSELSMENWGITNLLDPANAQDAATKNYVDGIQTALDSRLDALESQSDGPDFYKKKIVMDSAVTLAYVDLDHAAVPNSIVLANGRVMGHLGEDFSHALVDGVSRLTFIGDFASGGVEAVEDGDSIFVTYAVLA